MSKAWLILILFGFLFRFSGNSWQPIHEHMHVEAVALTGGRVVSVTHNLTTWVGGNDKFIWFFGIYGEILLYGGAAVLFRRVGKFGLGAMFPPVWQAAGSSDFAHLGQTALLIVYLTWFTLLVLAIARSIYDYSQETDKQKAARSHIPATLRG